MWSDSYRPHIIEEFIGNEDARRLVLRWLNKWVIGTKPLLLVGPPGVGKTSLVHAIANQFMYDLIEMNASDTRNKEQLDRLIMPVLKNTSIFGKPMLLFLDEVDGISGREDSGGKEAILKIMKDPSIPIIMAANKKDTKIKDLAKISKVIEFHPVPPGTLLGLLDHILKEENKELTKEEKDLLIRNSHGDIRSLLNIAQSKASGYEVKDEDRFDIDISEALNGFFEADSIEQAKDFLVNADAKYQDPRFGMSPEERRRDLIGAIFSSVVSSRVDIETIASTLDKISKLDTIVGRIANFRRWSLLRYMGNIVLYSLYGEITRKGIKYNQYAFPWSVMAPIFARARSINGTMHELALQFHTSTSTFGSLYFPYLIQTMINDKTDLISLVEKSELDESFADPLAKEVERQKKTKDLGKNIGYRKISRSEAQL
jgi:replication factor C large subunit